MWRRRGEENRHLFYMWPQRFAKLAKNSEITALGASENRLEAPTNFIVSLKIANFASLNPFPRIFGTTFDFLPSHNVNIDGETRFPVFPPTLSPVGKTKLLLDEKRFFKTIQASA